MALAPLIMASVLGKESTLDVNVSSATTYSVISIGAVTLVYFLAIIFVGPLILGSSFDFDTSLFAVLIFGSGVLSTMHLKTSVLYAGRRYRQLLYAAMSGVLLNAVIAASFTPLFGKVGIALGFLASSIVFTSSIWWASQSVQHKTVGWSN